MEVRQMQFDELGNMNGKTLMLLPGTACDYQTNFMTVLDRLGEKYHLICVNYDGFDGSGSVFPDMIFGGELYRNDVNKVSFILGSFRDHLDSAADSAGKRSYGSRNIRKS